MKLFVMFVGIVCLVFAGRALAEAPATEKTFAESNRWYVEFLANGMADVTNRNVSVAGGTVGVGYYLNPWLALSADLSGYGYANRETDGGAVNLTVGLRHHIFKIEKLQFFIDVAGGVLEASSTLPHGGTHFNFSFDFGPGVMYPLKDNVSLMAGVRYFHISNASTQGIHHNPSINGVQGVVGLVFRF